MSGHEFQLHNRVDKLGEIIGLKKNDVLKIVTYLEKDRTPFNPILNPMHESLTKLANNSPSPSEFTQKYNELKGKNVRDLDAFVFFLSELSDKSETSGIKKLLEPRHNFTATIESTLVADSLSSGNSNSKLSSTALAEMKDKVLKGTTSGIITLSPTALTSISKLAFSEKSKSRRKECKFHIYPEFPSWMHERLNLTWDFYPNPEKFEIDCEVNKLTLSTQEDMIVDDLLNCMSGFEGKFIKTPSLGDRHAERTFHIERSLDPAMRELAKRILPVCSHYSLIIRFVEEKSEFKWGLVNHALCASIRELLKNHYVFICQLENLQRKGNLSLQKLWYYVNPIMGFMEILASIIKVINKGDCCGSAVIDILYEKVLAYSGDPKLQELIFYLAQTTSRPYFEMLQDWIFKGQINDPYNEFMVSEDKDITKEKLKDDFNEKFWEKKYSISSQNTPKFLAVISEKILLTGKYLNAIFETGSMLGKDVNANELLNHENVVEKVGIKSRKFDLPEPVEIHFTVKEETYKQIVENAYNFSSKILLNLLLKEHRLVDRLRSLKHYFLLDQSDFMVHFMDISEEELDKKTSEIRLNKIESLLEVSLRITSANSDPYKDDLRCKFLINDLKSMVMKIQGVVQKNVDSELDLDKNKTLKGLDAFVLDYSIKWPLSLIINKKTLFKYQILFRHLFLMKHVERQLLTVWLCTKSGEMCLGRSYPYYSLACALRQRMLNFVQNFLNYMTFEVIESSWNIFENNLKEVANIDNVIEHHTKFLDTCLRDCIITNDSFLLIQKILSECIMFSVFVQGVTKNIKDKEESSQLEWKSMTLKESQERRKQILQEISDDLNKMVSDQAFATSIKNYDNKFSKLLLDLLAKIINDMSNGLGETKIGNVLYRLDFNDHYRNQIEKLRLSKSMMYHN